MGRPKLLLPLGDSTVLGRLVDSLENGGVDRIILVIPPDGDELQTWADRREIEVAVNPHPERGMLSTILCGLRRIHSPNRTSEGSLESPLLISPSDLPGITSDTIRRLLEKLPCEQKLIVPTYRGKRGHPLLIAPELIPELFELDPQIGLKQIRELHDVLEMPVDDPGIVCDVDTPDDYDRFRCDR